MGERKVLNKYYPPDFDTIYLKKFGQRNTGYDPHKQIEVRMMLPFSVQCVKCGEFSYRGKKFNSRKENVHGEDYKGIKKVRFYMKCGVCSNIFSIKTDPEHGDYEVEFGVTRNFESWTKAKEEDERERKEREDEEMGDSMKALENRTLQQKMEADQMDALDGILAMNKRNETVNIDGLLQTREAKKAQEEARKNAEAKKAAEAQLEADEREAEEVFKQKQSVFKRITGDGEAGSGSASAGAGASGTAVGKWAAMFGAPQQPASEVVAPAKKRKLNENAGDAVTAADSAAPAAPGALSAVVVKKKKVDKKKKKKKSKKTKKEKTDDPSVATGASNSAGGGVLGLGDYGSSSSD
eukprot:INCI8741.1.p1 GENE.INCI8741.1~~INCI8741.1.p1  ORF type:complete len:352 (-),score=91.04 INCI8741.1:388-1443(-)